ncbi:hypothetical protein A167_00152 [Alcanivorax sp. S71-1-4]|uniref:CsgG/HfaB family protein n=1 Tax=Alcanivorax sp. S71-1-4 TaxID=1177159 RepID=UPI00135CA39F|nr:CsgG/HfaB family protein [Alcanivorax sp. S71-1-4]KAF0811120.1 hypothetical protein A167_00152 [Alcanivorax sp. S71-1-4]
MRTLYRFLISAFVFALLLPQHSLAATETVTREATGFGSTPQTAVANALVEAARQGLGVTVTLDPDFRSQTYEWVVSQQIATGAWRSEPEARLPTLAPVQSYRVLDTKQVNEDLWQARVEARLLTHKSIGPDRSALPSLVIGTLRTSGSSYDLGRPIPPATVRNNLRNALVTSFADSGRLRILDRDYSADVAGERAVSASSLMPEEQVRLGRQQGADLVLVGDIESFQLGRPGRSYYGAQFNTLEPVIRIQYRLLETATGGVLRAGTFNYTEAPGTLRSKLRDADIDPDREPERIGEFLYPDVARALTGEVMDALYPVRVLSVQGDRVYITQGSGRLSTGQQLTVHQLDGEMKDPDTGLAIRLETPPLATLRVTGVQQDYAVAELVDGDRGSLNEQAVVRNVPAETRRPGGPGRPMTPGSSEAPISWD